MLTKQELITLLDRYNISYSEAPPNKVEAALLKLDKYVEEEFGVTILSDWEQCEYKPSADIYTTSFNFNTVGHLKVA